MKPRMAESGERELLDAEQVAEMLGMTSDWVYEQSRKGRIPTITLGRYRRYRRAAIEEWLLSLERGSVRATNRDGWESPPHRRSRTKGVGLDARQR